MADRKRKTRKKKEEEEAAKVPEAEPELPDGPKTYIVGAQWSTLKSINEGIKLCNTGDKLVVSAGEYNEQLVFGQPDLHIRGENAEGQQNVVILGGVRISSAPEKPTTGTLSNICIHKGLDIEGGSVNISDCTSQNARHGAAIFPFANPQLKNCTFQNVEMSCVYAFPNSGGSCRSCKMLGSKNNTESVGIFVDDSRTQFKDNQVSEHKTGVYIHSGSSSLVLESSKISNCSSIGLHITKNATPTCNKNTITSCGYYGLVVEDSSSPNLSKNTISALPVVIHKGCKPVLKNNTITGIFTDHNEVTNDHLQSQY